MYGNMPRNCLAYRATSQKVSSLLDFNSADGIRPNYVTEHLTERIPDHVVKRTRDASILLGRLVIGGIGGLFVPIGIALAWLPFRRSPESLQLTVVFLAGVLLVGAWVASIYMVGRLAAIGWSQSRLPVVEIAGNLITVRWNGETIESTIRDCNLRLGPARQMKYASRKGGLLPTFKRNLILIDLPPLYRDALGFVRSYTTVAVGYTDESMANWIAALGMDVEPVRTPE